MPATCVTSHPARRRHGSTTVLILWRRDGGFQRPAMARTPGHRRRSSWRRVPMAHRRGRTQCRSRDRACESCRPRRTQSWSCPPTRTASPRHSCPAIRAWRRSTGRAATARPPLPWPQGRPAVGHRRPATVQRSNRPLRRHRGRPERSTCSEAAELGEPAQEAVRASDEWRERTTRRQRRPARRR